MATTCLAQEKEIYEPALVLGGPFWGFDCQVPEGETAYDWWGFFSVFKTKTLIPGKVWWYNGIQYGSAFDEGPKDNWGGNSRVVFRGEGKVLSRATTWISTGWYTRIAEKGSEYGPGVTAYVGGSFHIGSGFHVVGEYGWSDRGPRFQSELKLGVALDTSLLQKK
jgi:hypothetical protein